MLDGVHEVPNLLTLGRHGLFLNNSMDDNVLLGMQIADHINRPEGADSQEWKTQMLAFMNLRFAREVMCHEGTRARGIQAGP